MDQELLECISKLDTLKALGVLSPEEYQQKKDHLVDTWVTTGTIPAPPAAQASAAAAKVSFTPFRGTAISPLFVPTVTSSVPASRGPTQETVTCAVHNKPRGISNMVHMGTNEDGTELTSHYTANTHQNITFLPSLYPLPLRV